MNILFVTENCGHFGGVEVAVAEAADALRGRGHRCALAYGRKTAQDVASFEASFDTCRGVQELGPHATPLSDLVAGFRPDVIFAHKVPTVSILLPFVGKTRVVRMVHDHDVTCPRRHKYKFLTGRICPHRADWRCFLDGAMVGRDNQRRLAWQSLPQFFSEQERHRQLDGILLASRAMQEEFLANGFAADRLHCLAPVVRWELSDPSPPAREPHILYVGQMVRGKGVDLLLRACQRLNGVWQATLVGDGNAAPGLRRLAEELGIGDRVGFVGWVPHGQLASYYDMARLVAVPSRWPEPFGLVGLEAMRYGRPVVAFGVGGIPDWLSDGVTGISVAEQDVDGFAYALQRLVDNPEVASRMGAAGYDRLRRQFSFQRYIDGLEAWLEGGTRQCISA